MSNTTTFDTSSRYIYLPITVQALSGVRHDFDAIFDTGAPRTEFSDRALLYAGLLDSTQDVTLPEGLPTKKYGHVQIPAIEICGHTIANLQVFVSHFEKSWGIDALIGLDFVRKFRTTIDYATGTLTTENL